CPATVDALAPVGDWNPAPNRLRCLTAVLQVAARAFRDDASAEEALTELNTVIARPAHAVRILQHVRGRRHGFDPTAVTRIPISSFRRGGAHGVPLVSMLRSPMANCHYLSVIFPALMLLVACALDVGLRERSQMAWGVPAACLVILMPASLARMYLVPHKTDWRGLAARVAEKGPDLPAWFYEDIGADPFRYYRPAQPAHQILKSFEDKAAGWQKAGYLEQFRAQPQGFWLVVYLTETDPDEQAAIEQLLEREYTVSDEGSFAASPPLRLLLCRPRESQAGQAP